MHLAFPALLLLASPVWSAPGTGIQKVSPEDARRARRALSDSPTGGYAPGVVDCPEDRPTIRSASTLSPNESAWLETRRQNTIQPMTAFLEASNITGFDASAYIAANQANLTLIPNIALAVSGGGYRALMNGAGFIAAADSRVPGSSDAYGLGGLLQSSTYLAGLSGGGWLVGSIFANNFSTVVQLRDGSPGSSVWAFDSSIFEGPEESGLSILNMAEYWVDIYDQVSQKADAGFNTTITDYWGRALSYQLINATDGGPGYTFSSISQMGDFVAGNQPMPILVADSRKSGTQVISLNSTVLEFNPWEFGTFDPTVFGFAPVQYIGSKFSNGTIPSTEKCVSGFDQLGYVMGTSSTLFNQFLLTNISQYNIPDYLTEGIDYILTDIGDDEEDIADYSPNPFYGYNTATNLDDGEEQLTVVDGGEDLQNIPLHPLIQPVRAVDVIFAVDSSADTTYFWPNATALRATWERSLEPISNGTQFPAVPDAETFINLGLNRRPTFFGCDVNNFTAGSNIPPLIVYIPNTPYTAWSNVSTFDPSYSDEQRNSIIENGYNVATMGNGTVSGGSTWRTCAGCAVMQRTWAKTNTTVPDVCQTCFTQFCWNGTVDSTPVSDFEPQPLLALTDSGGSAIRMGGSGIFSVFTVVSLATSLSLML
ncbi:lysophospholipase catalytic domain-containing protein [Xylariales sp. PMI_506]|nr:lysophospholipase catalytic domain-containing protein [Xylariales sp. PMI_506]